MADRLYTTIEPRISASVPGMPQPTLLRYIQSAARVVCERTLAWRYEQDVQILTPGEYRYEYETPSNTEVCAVLHTALNGVGVTWVTEEELHDRYPSWPSETVTERSAPRVFSQYDTQNYVVAPVPDSDTTYNIKMFLALRPTLSATGMDSVVFNEVEDLIEHAVLQEAQVLTEKSWSDRQLANYHAKQLIFKIAERRAKANITAGRVSLRVKNVAWV